MHVQFTTVPFKVQRVSDQERYIQDLSLKLVIFNSGFLNFILLMFAFIKQYLYSKKKRKNDLKTIQKSSLKHVFNRF